MRLRSIRPRIRSRISRTLILVAGLLDARRCTRQAELADTEGDRPPLDQLLAPWRVTTIPVGRHHAHSGRMARRAH